MFVRSGRSGGWAMLSTEFVDKSVDNSADLGALYGSGHDRTFLPKIWRLN
jgi:hypothetical protein